MRRRAFAMIRKRAPLFLKQRGVTLVELIIAIVVLSIAVGVLFGVFANLLKMTVMPEVLDRSAELAEQQLERISALRFSQIVDEGPVNFSGNFSDYTYQIIVSAVPDDLADDPSMLDYKQVEIIVHHSVSEDISLKTVVTNL